MVRNKNKRIFQFENDMVGLCERKNKKITFSFRKGFWSFISFCLCVSISCIKQNPSGLILVLANLYIWGFSLFCFRCFVVFGSRMITKIVLFFSKRKLFIQAELFISSRFFWAILVLFSFSLISIIFVFCHCPRIFWFQMKMLSVKKMIV